MIIGVAAVAYVAYKGTKVTEALNPLNENNVANQASNAAIKTVSGGRFLSLGDFLFNVLNPNAPGENGTL